MLTYLTSQRRLYTQLPVLWNLYSVAQREESVESYNEVGMFVKQLGNAPDYARGVNARTKTKPLTACRVFVTKCNHKGIHTQVQMHQIAKITLFNSTGI